ncbi:hypothetical protein QR680_012323 [Steinernema hermaphroditum]|uniref:Cdc23 domain-containing protein n=1 Tax=Steinernema hermaphroditum TaxID=289476 RepID=A0AA39M0K8_9BILA|nr:hypothetical protein QR680_012323 [Steinernema hermaphroditum]
MFAGNYKYEDLVPDLEWLYDECHNRCMIDGMAWAGEVLWGLPDEWKAQYRLRSDPLGAIQTLVYDRLVGFAWSLIQKREFHRAAFYLKKISKPNPEVTFLYYWARYLACENNRLETESESINRENREKERYVDEDLPVMLNELIEIRNKEGDNMDVFLLYLLGKVQVSMRQLPEATRTLKKVVQRERRLWPAWMELVQTIDSPNELSAVELQGNYWMTNWFRADALYRFQLHKTAGNFYQFLINKGLGQLHHLIAPLASCKARQQEHDHAMDLFEIIRSEDPYRIHFMDLYSDSLYVRGHKVKLCQLSQQLYKTHKYTFEVCCIVANYYSLRREHDKAIAFMQRAIRMNPLAASPWVLVGHEFMEVKNSSAACLAYRKATEVDPHDSRGWYGLGQLYDIMKMHSYSLEYYKRAHRCKPDDSRMLVALGNVYEALNRLQEAKNTYMKAYQVGDIEGTALIRMARVCERNNEKDEAAAAYEQYVVEYANIEYVEHMSLCLKYLANYYLNKADVPRARQYAERCTEFEPSQEEGKKLLAQINDLMNKEGEEGVRKMLKTACSTAIEEEPRSDTEMMEEHEAETDAESNDGDDEMEDSSPDQEESPEGSVPQQEQNDPDESSEL